MTPLRTRGLLPHAIAKEIAWTTSDIAAITEIVASAGRSGETSLTVWALRARLAALEAYQQTTATIDARVREGLQTATVLIVPL